MAIIGSILFAALVIWVVETTPDAPDPHTKIEPPKEMTYEGGTTISEEKDGKTIWELTADKITVTLENQNAEFKNVVAKFYQDDGNMIQATAQNGSLHREQKNIYLDGKVAVESSDGKRITCEELQWNNEEHLLSAIGNVDLETEDSKLTADRVDFDPGSNNAIATGRVKLNREDIKASGDRLETSNDFKKFLLTGNAHIVKGGSN